jgi:hypothetical protein
MPIGIIATGRLMKSADSGEGTSEFIATTLRAVRNSHRSNQPHGLAQKHVSVEVRGR